MRRRTLLAGAAAAGLTGCLDAVGEPPGADGRDGGTTTDGRRYEACPREVVPADMLPAAVRAEVDAALEGRYEGDRVSLRETMHVESSYVSVDDRYYDPAVAVEGDQEVLTLERVQPKALPDPRPVSVEHGFEGERTVTVELVAADGTTLVDETLDRWPGGETKFGETARVGTHEARVTVADGDAVELEAAADVRVDESHFDARLAVDPDGVEATAAVAELVPCQYDG
jgi:hypothetical protein